MPPHSSKVPSSETRFEEMSPIKLTEQRIGKLAKRLSDQTGLAFRPASKQVERRLSGRDGGRHAVRCRVCRGQELSRFVILDSRGTHPVENGSSIRDLGIRNTRTCGCARQRQVSKLPVIVE